MSQQPIGLAAGRHLHRALRHQRLHQGTHRLRRSRGFAQHRAAGIAQDRARLGRSTTSAQQQTPRVKREGERQLVIAKAVALTPAFA